MQKYVKGDVSIRDSLKKNVSQRRLESHRPHGTGAGLQNAEYLKIGVERCLEDHVLTTLVFITSTRLAGFQ